MNKIICMLLILLLCGAAAAEEVNLGTAFRVDEKLTIDLDGNGTEEEIILRIEGVDYEQELVIYVFGSDGDFYSYNLHAPIAVQSFVADIDGDGNQEICISADWYSDDYFTTCLRFIENEGLEPLMFPDVGRNFISDGETKEGYGCITGLKDGLLTLSGSQDVLGTWFMQRSFRLEDGEFIFADEGMWRLSEDSRGIEALVLARDIPVTMADGSAATLKAGEKLLPMATDLESKLLFETTDGRSGSIELEFDSETGWGFTIGGMPEADIFEWLPYAD